IISLLRDPARARQMGERGLQIVKEKFSCAAQVESIENLYERLLARKRVATQASVERGVRQESARLQ
ncbi:MAG: hypothetical protein ICV68_10830, partial [Pyrinomonadaceae bacterium]|nr:hypothetical protein [Pyrinomonadaceae bacterium]